MLDESSIHKRWWAKIVFIFDQIKNCFILSLDNIVQKFQPLLWFIFSAKDDLRNYHQLVFLLLQSYTNSSCFSVYNAGGLPVRCCFYQIKTCWWPTFEALIFCAINFMICIVMYSSGVSYWRQSKRKWEYQKANKSNFQRNLSGF